GAAARQRDHVKRHRVIAAANQDRAPVSHRLSHFRRAASRPDPRPVRGYTAPTASGVRLASGMLWTQRTGQIGRRLDLPPPYRLVVLREAGDAFCHASAHAAELGAGTLIFVGRFDVAEFAVVLEPEEPLAAARCVFYAGMVALGDALAACAPP